KMQQAKWPYSWVNSVDDPHLAQRGSVTGRLVLEDPLAPKGSSKTLPHLIVGLAHPDADAATLESRRAARADMFEEFMKSHPEVARRGFRTPPMNADAASFTHDAGYYDFFVHGNPDGTFSIP